MARTRYPSVEAYAASLPEGWSSFPRCEISASIFDLLRERGTFDGFEDLPPLVATHALRPSPTGWLPEIAGVGAFLAVRDARFNGPSGEVDFLQWMDVINSSILTQHMGREIETPSSAVAWVPGAWADFHRGTTMSASMLGTNAAEIALSHPPHIFPGAWTEVRRRILTGALARAGAVQPTVRATRAPDGGTRFHATWS